jgi:hypothetical protein
MKTPAAITSRHALEAHRRFRLRVRNKKREIPSKPKRSNLAAIIQFVGGGNRREGDVVPLAEVAIIILTCAELTLEVRLTGADGNTHVASTGNPVQANVIV